MPEQIPLEDYNRLRDQVTSLGLFKRTYWHYGWSAGFALGMLLLNMYAITLTDNVFIQALNAIIFGFFSVQLGMIGHDLSHGAVFKSPKVNRFFASVAWSLVGGLSENRWYEKHNQHHKGPNHIGHDPDVTIPFMFTQKQIEVSSPFLRTWVLPYQYVLFWPSLVFIYPWNVTLGMRSYFKNPTPRVVMEIFFILIHFFVLLYIPFAYLPPLVAIIFFVVMFTTIGIYMGLVFAPNHKGMEELRSNETFHWAYQITLTRNIYPSWIIFYLFGGLNFQIEHHLFPSMSRFNYKKACAAVQAFCVAKDLSYNQKTWTGSLHEMQTALIRESKRIH